MTGAGWLLMLGSLGFVVGLVAFCFYRVLTTPTASNRMHAPLDIETGEKME